MDLYNRSPVTPQIPHSQTGLTMNTNVKSALYLEEPLTAYLARSTVVMLRSQRMPYYIPILTLLGFFVRKTSQRIYAAAGLGDNYFGHSGCTGAAVANRLVNSAEFRARRVPGCNIQPDRTRRITRGTAAGRTLEVPVLADGLCSSAKTGQNALARRPAVKHEPGLCLNRLLEVCAQLFVMSYVRRTNSPEGLKHRKPFTISALRVMHIQIRI